MAVRTSGAPANQGFRFVWFSRGRGRGHAVSDIWIAREVLALRPDTSIDFVSYADGAETFRARGVAVIDLGLPPDPPFLEMVVQGARVVQSTRPRLVVAHEEYAALVAARIFEVPSLFLTDFFQDPSWSFMTALIDASEVIFTGEKGLFTEPPYARGKIHYVGPAIPKFRYGRADRERARRELGLPADAVVVLCLPGSWTERAFPIAGLVAAAWQKLPYELKRLLWLASTDHAEVRDQLQRWPEVSVLAVDWQPDRLIAASDVVITKGTRKTLYQVAALGAPSISISAGLNWPDDVVAAHIPSNTLVSREALSPERLAELMVEKISRGWLAEASLPQWRGVTAAAEVIVAHVDALREGLH